jgi:hypothetical protein
MTGALTCRQLSGAALKRFAFNQRHQLKAKRFVRILARISNLCVTGGWHLKKTDRADREFDPIPAS